LRLVRVALFPAGFGVGFLLALPLIVFVTDAISNPEMLKVDVSVEGDPPKAVLKVAYDGSVYLDGFTIQVKLSDGGTLSLALGRLEGGSSRSIELPISLVQTAEIEEVSLSFRVAGIYAVEVRTTE